MHLQLDAIGCFEMWIQNILHMLVGTRLLTAVNSTKEIGSVNNTLHQGAGDSPQIRSFGKRREEDRVLAGASGEGKRPDVQTLLRPFEFQCWLLAR